MGNFSNLQQEQQVNSDHSDYDRALVECIRIFARRGKQIREERERQSRQETTNEQLPELHHKKDSDVRYGLISHEQAVGEVYAKYKAGELAISEMSTMELGLFGEASRQRTTNLLWNAEHHRFFLNRVDELDPYLNDAERERIMEMLDESRWGERELGEVKSLLENALWFGNLKRAGRKSPIKREKGRE